VNSLVSRTVGGGSGNRWGWTDGWMKDMSEVDGSLIYLNRAIKCNAMISPTLTSPGTCHENQERGAAIEKSES